MAYVFPRGVAKYATYAAAVAVVLAGVAFSITRNTPTGEIATDHLLDLKTSSGGQKWYVNALGGSAQSGSLSTDTLISCDSIDSTSTGMLICGTDAGATAITQTAADARFVNLSGDTMTGNLVLQGKNLTASGVYATGSLSASGALSVDGLVWLNSNTSITGSFTARGAMSGSSLAVSNLTSCDTIDTNAAGELTCGSDAGGTYTAGQGLSVASNVFTLNTALTGATLKLSGSLSASGALSVDGLSWLNSNTVITGTLTTTKPITSSGGVVSPNRDFIIILSNPQTRASSGASIFQFYAPFDGQFNSAFLSHDPNGSGVTIDVNVNSRSIFSTLLTTDEQEKTSTGATTPAVFGNTTFLRNNMIQIDMDACGTGAGAQCPEGVVLQLSATGSIFP